MSTELRHSAPSSSLPTLSQDTKVAVVSTEWNHEITDALADGAFEALGKAGVQYNHYVVPGAVELTFAASRLIGKYDAVIVLGCVIRGGTPHFDYVCQSVTDGVTRLNAAGVCPVIFGVLTVDSIGDALDRSGGRLGNKGYEAGETAIKMIDFACKVSH